MLYKYPGEKIIEDTAELPAFDQDTLKRVHNEGWREGYNSGYIDRETGDIRWMAVEPCPYTEDALVAAYDEGVKDGQGGIVLELDLWL